MLLEIYINHKFKKKNVLLKILKTEKKKKKELITFSCFHIKFLKIVN